MITFLWLHFEYDRGIQIILDFRLTNSLYVTDLTVFKEVLIGLRKRKVYKYTGKSSRKRGNIALLHKHSS